MTTLQQVLASKDGELLEVGKDATVEDALALMAKKNIGSLIVREEGRLIGIVTERHFTRKVFLAGITSPGTKVGDIMSSNVIVGRPHTTVDEALALMASKGFRHLPVCDGQEVIGMVTMTDLVQTLVGDREFTISQLEEYLHR